MANQITDASFELQSAAWLISNEATFQTPGDAYEGSYVMQHHEVRSFIGGDVETKWGQHITLDDTGSRNLRFRVRRTATTGGLTDVSLIVKLINGHGNVAFAWFAYDSVTINAADITSEWVEYSIEDSTPPSTTVMLQVSVAYGGGGTPIFDLTLEFDSFTLLTAAEEADLVKRREIKEAFVAWLALITTGNGFSHDVVASVDGIRPQRLLDGHPTLMTVYGEERKEGAELHRRRGHLQLITYIVAKETATLTAEQVCDEVCGDIQTKVEQQESAQFLGLPYVENVVMTRIEPIELAEEVHRGTRIWECVTMVVYRHTIGSP